MVSSASDATNRRTYKAFGLRIAADLDLPELAILDDAGAEEIDVEIGRASIAPPPPQAKAIDASLHVLGGRVWLETPAGRFFAMQGRRIIYDPAPRAQARDIRQFALGSMLGAILHQRGILPLHANAIGLGDHAIAVAGPSGAGKSTLAAAFLRRGRTVLSDDVCAVTFDGPARPLVLPGLARIKLWGDSLDALGQSREGLERIADGYDKFSLPAAPAAPEPAPLRRFYAIEPDGGAAIGARRLKGAAAVNAVLSNVYRYPLAAALGKPDALFAQVLCLVKAVEVWSLSAPRDLALLPALVDSLTTERFEDLP